MNTPDTEWEKELREKLKDFGSRCYWYGEETGDYDINRMEEYEPETLNKIVTLLTSRDTYWKERVDAEIADAVELTKREIKHRVERYFKDAYLSLKQQGGVHIHLEEIQEIIDDSTPPGVDLRN